MSSWREGGDRVHEKKLPSLGRLSELGRGESLEPSEVWRRQGRENPLSPIRYGGGRARRSQSQPVQTEQHLQQLIPLLSHLRTTILSFVVHCSLLVPQLTLLSPTYTLAKDILTNLTFFPNNGERVILVVDEAHNLQHDESLLNFCNSQDLEKTILMTATPPNTMKTGVISCDLVYHFPVNEAIQKWYICDYCLYLPLEFAQNVLFREENDEGDEGDEHDDTSSVLPSEISTKETKMPAVECLDSEIREIFDDDKSLDIRDKVFYSARILLLSLGKVKLVILLVQLLFSKISLKMLHSSIVRKYPMHLVDPVFSSPLIRYGQCLINGLLKTGSTKCIGYFRTIEECNIFREIFEKVTAKYHFLDCWTRSITSFTLPNESNNILTEFQRKHCISLLASVRILDEGIDIPKCDSIFLSNLTDSFSAIRTVQRMFRANRLDPDNDNKKENIYFWTNEYLKSLDALKLLRENDIHFESKIRCLSGNYTLETYKNHKEDK